MSSDVADLFFVSADSPRLSEALTHPSYSNESRDGPHNQRLEFLGDAVLDLCVSEYLWRQFPDADEGELTRRRAQLVNTDALAHFARQHNLADALRLGRGAEGHGLRNSTNVMADVVEALIAAAYLDRGLDAARKACTRVIEHGLAEASGQESRDPKTALQELVQARGQDAPVYKLLATGGPDHERWFEINVSVGGEDLGTGRGRSKRLAERAAAQTAIELLNQRTER